MQEVELRQDELLPALWCHGNGWLDCAGDDERSKDGEYSLSLSLSPSPFTMVNIMPFVPH